MVKVSPERDQLLAEFSKKTLEDRYLLKGESYQDCFRRVAEAFADNENHAQRMYDYISQLWFMPATPVLSNGGTDRGLPISCYLRSVEDTLESIIDTWVEGAYLGAGGGGLGTGWSNLRGIGEPVRGRGESSGIIPFMKVSDSEVLAISQGSLRRGSEAAYLHISHPEIEEFLEIRKPSGDFNRKSLNLHHGVVIPDEFMIAVKENTPWALKDPRSREIKKEVNARELFQKILENRMSSGEPYILFEDNANKYFSQHQKDQGMRVSQSNLCIEIMLHTGLDQYGKTRTAVCCLGSMNFERFDEWKGNDQFVEDCLRFLDNVLDDFIVKTKNRKGFENAHYSALQERSVGLGVMGFHSYLQSKNLPLDSAIAKAINKNAFEWIKNVADNVNEKLAIEKTPCPDAGALGINKRFSHMLAVAPTASISIIAGATSPCIEPFQANIFTHKTLSGSFEVRNKHLTKVLGEIGMDSEDVWDSILENDGSIQHLDLPQEIKDVFKTANEIDQRWLIELAADRTPYICQGQSLNLFLKGEADKWDLLMLHYKAWQLGIKSLYYLRSRSVMRAGFVGGVEKDNTVKRSEVFTHAIKTDYEECVACQ
jgi:ribonucleoside-diphosphate reductase alpha chain